MYEEKRQHPRIPSQAQVKFRAEEGDRWGISYEEGTVENISRGGVFVATANPLPRGTVVSLAIDLPVEIERRTVKVTALVRWTRERFDPGGMGLEFIDFEGEGRSRLLKWLEEAKKTATGS